MDRKLQQIQNREALYEQVYQSFLRNFEINYLKMDVEPIAYPSFDHTVNPWEHAYVMMVRDCFALSYLYRPPFVACNGAVFYAEEPLFRLPNEPNAYGSCGTAQGFHQKVDVYISDQVVEFAESMIRRTQDKREQDALAECTRQIALARSRGEIVVETWE